MRFKAKLAVEQVHALHSLIGPIARLTGSPKHTGDSLNASAGEGSSLFVGSSAAGVSVVHLDPDHFRISVRSGRADADGVACFAELLSDKIFLEHRIESATNNAIVFEIDLYMLKTALHSIITSISITTNNGHNSKGLHNSNASSTGSAFQFSSGALSVIVMKLAKKAGLPCLCIEAQQAGRYGQIDQNHALPIRIMRATEMQYHLPPKISMPDVQLELPVDGRVPIRTVLERLKGISPQVYLDGSMAGELTLRIESDGASIRTFYNKLIPRFEDCKGSQNEDMNSSPSSCTLKVDSKKMFSCFQWQTSMGIGRAVGSAVLCMVENEMLVVHVLLNPDDLGFFTYYIPVHFLSADHLDC